MLRLLASWFLLESITMMSQADLSGEGACKVWLLFPSLKMLIQCVSVVGGGQELPMVGLILR